MQSKKSLETFVGDLQGKTVAVVYSFSNRVDPASTWYDRWRSDVVSYAGKGVERLGAEPRYLDVELYIQQIAEYREPIADYIINLHSGLIRISDWPVISSGASWRRIPVSPCAADVHIVGERKDITNAIAAQTQLARAAPWTSEANSDRRFVIKPRDLGMSRDVRVVTASEIGTFSRSRVIVEEYIEGVDATVCVIRLPNNQYVVVNGQLHLNEGMAITGVFTEEQKNGERNSGERLRKPVTIERDLQEEIVHLCNLIGPSTTYRIDFRIKCDPAAPPASMQLSTSVFLEANPTPTVSEKSSYGWMFRDFLDGRAHFESKVDPVLLSYLRSLGEYGAYVALMLFNAQKDEDYYL